MGGGPLATSAVTASAVAWRSPDDYSVLSFGKDVVAAKSQDQIKSNEAVVDSVLALRGFGTTDVAGALVAAAGHGIQTVLVADQNGIAEIELGTGPTTQVFATGLDCPLTAFTISRADALQQDAPARLSCAPASSSLALKVVDADDVPVQDLEFELFQDGHRIPSWIGSTHLSRLGLRPWTDGRGRLTIPGLATGEYALYFAGAPMERGFVKSFSLAPSTATEYTVVVRRDR